ncbi:prevent-host-death protein [Epilithonimonas sp.]|uniref:prevent-host-death protein n=1 Tax=Epilithonimonas sp. TaxID=2894511 RepID=UPI0028A0DF5D|nr:prevent-host-death protein [Epilithonimonas sp.]
MKFTLEITKPEIGSKLGFKTIYFNAFKINIIERYSNSTPSKFYHIVVKLRTINDEIINTKTGSGRLMIKESDFLPYSHLAKALTSYDYRNHNVDRNKIEDDFINFVLSRMAVHYQL